MIVAGVGHGATFSEAIRVAEPWTVRSELGGIALLVLVAIGLWRLLRTDDSR